MNPASVIVYAVLLLLILFLYKEILRPTVSFILAIGILLIGQVLSPKEALMGFANEQLWIIILLLIFSNTLSKTRVVDTFFRSAFKGATTTSGFIQRMLLGIGIPSAFLNNTPLVAMMMPYVYRWSKRRSISASQLLIPLSYISILGGCVTLIGTSTNLIANGLAVEYGEAPLRMFDFAWVGVPMLLIGGLYILLVHRRMLPENVAVSEQESLREYTLEAIVKSGSPLIGCEIGEGGLRHLEGVFLVEVNRGDQRFSPVEPSLSLEEGDALVFVGDTERVLDITRPALGLSLPTHSELPPDALKEIVEVVLAPQSTLLGRMVKESDFRARFNAAILAIHRNGERLEGKIGDVILEAGDDLLVLVGPDFNTRVTRTRDFYVVSKVKALHDISPLVSYFLLFGLGAAIALSVLDLIPLFTSLVVLVLATMVFRIQSASELRTKVDFDLIIIIAMGLALGKAMMNSGVADTMASAVDGLLASFGPWALIAGFFLITNLLSAFMTSKAAVAIVLPVALSTAHSLGLPIPPFILVVAFGGAANFITPIGYQTNLMVYGPGGYSFGDYMKIGLPLTLIYLVVCTVVLCWQFGL